MIATTNTEKNKRRQIAIGGTVGTAALVASLFAFSAGASADTLDGSVEAERVSEIDAGAVIVEMTEADLNEHDLGSPEGAGVGVEAEHVSEIDADAVVIEMTEADVAEYEL